MTDSESRRSSSLETSPSVGLRSESKSSASAESNARRSSTSSQRAAPTS
ncbi:MAG: hypothetical protein M0D55_06895 [Elusimicrobiota bacterium]|nr:MAG: hypothetical protein M0D55_06895 [Elusimicrobiota bacterium]